MFERIAVKEAEKNRKTRNQLLQATNKKSGGNRGKEPETKETSDDEDDNEGPVYIVDY